MFSCFSDRIINDTNKRDEVDRFLNFKIIQKDNDDISNILQFKIKFPTNKLVFNKKSDHFYSDITIDILITDDNDKIILSDSWNEKVIKKYYDDTKSFKDVELNYDITLPFGFYNINTIINDFENHNNWINNLDFEVIKNDGLSDISVFYKENTTRLYNTVR